MKQQAVAVALTVLATPSCSHPPPGELVYAERAFSKSAEQTIPSAKVHVYTPGAVRQTSTDEHLNLLLQTDGVSTVTQVVPLVSEALKRIGSVTNPVPERTDALCSTSNIAEGTERIVTVVAPRGQRTIQLQHVSRSRSGNGVDATCENAQAVARLLDTTLTSVP